MGIQDSINNHNREMFKQIFKLNEPIGGDMDLINGKHYPMWSQFVDKQSDFIGGTLEDHDMNMTGLTKITGISLDQNGDESAYFTINGEDFSCGFDVGHGGIGAGEKGWVTFHGYGGHVFRIKKANNMDLSSRKIGATGRYTKVGEDMTWPSFNQGECEWRLRHASEEAVLNDRFVVASIVSAYRELIKMPQKKRNAICKALMEAK